MSDLDRARLTVEVVAKMREVAARETASGAQVAHAVDQCWARSVSPQIGSYLHAVRDLAEVSEVVGMHCSRAATREVLTAMRQNADDALRAAERALEAVERAEYRPRREVLS